MPKTSICDVTRGLDVLEERTELERLKNVGVLKPYSDTIIKKNALIFALEIYQEYMKNIEIQYFCILFCELCNYINLFSKVYWQIFGGR